MDSANAVSPRARKSATVKGTRMAGTSRNVLTVRPRLWPVIRARQPLIEGPSPTCPPRRVTTNAQTLYWVVNDIARWAHRRGGGRRVTFEGHDFTPLKGVDRGPSRSA